MFSGLGSISDLNQQFAQFTTNLTNLDNLQNESSSTGSDSQSIPHPPADTDKFQQLENELSEYKAMYESALDSLGTTQKEVDAQKQMVLDLQEEVKEVRGYLSATSTSFEAYRSEAEENIQNLKQLELNASSRMPISPNAETLPMKQHGEIVANLQEQIENLKIADFRRNEEIKLLNAKYVEAESTIQSHLKEKEEWALKHESAIGDFIKHIGELNSQKEQMEGNMMEFQHQIKTLKSELQTQADNFKLQLEEATQEALRKSDSVATSETETERLKAEVQKTKLNLSESDGKIVTLTEKLKDMMHRFAELKTKSAAQLQQAEDKYADLTKIAQAKDSEILSFKLKTENVDRSASDLRLKAGELAERYSEAQREVARLTQLCEDVSEREASLVEERDKLRAEVRAALNEKEELAESLSVLKELAASATSEHESAIQLLKDSHEQANKAYKENIDQLQGEVALLTNRMKQDAESAGNLDQYKKKAQLALKKANNQVATLTEEVQRLRVASEESAGRLQEAQEATNAAENQVRDIRTKINILEDELAKALLQQDRLKLEAEESAKNAALEIADLKEKVSALGRERGRKDSHSRYLRNQQDAGDSDNGLNVRGRHERESSDFVSVVVRSNGGADSGCGALADQHSPSPSASSYSEVSAPPALPTLQTELHHPQLAVSGSTGSAATSCVPADNRQLRESSWAMVASASAAGSRIASTNASSSGSIADSASKHAETDASVDGTHNDKNGKNQTFAADNNASLSEHGPDVSEFDAKPSADSLMFVNQLQRQLEGLKKDLAMRGIDLEAAHHHLQYERDEKRALQTRVEELMAYLERIKQQDGPDSATNMEYLKNCVFKFMCSVDFSERRRLYPVIATILKLTSQEMLAIENAFQTIEARDNELQNTLSAIGSSLGSFWDFSATAIMGTSTSSSTITSTNTSSNQGPRPT